MLDINMTKAEIVDYPQIVNNALAMKIMGKRAQQNSFYLIQNKKNGCFEGEDSACRQDSPCTVRLHVSKDIALG
jgi:hypothetical protein